MTTLVVHPATGPLRGSVPVPSDADIGHVAFLFGALGRGETRLRRFTRTADNLAMAACLRALGVVIAEGDATAHAGDLVVAGVGLDGLRAPGRPLEGGDSETVLALASAVLSAQPFRTTLLTGPRLAARSLTDVLRPMRQRGAAVDGRHDVDRPGAILPPLLLGPLPEGRRTAALQYESHLASAAIKGAVLVSGLFAEGPTFFREPSVSRDHVERIAATLGLPLRTVGPVVQVDPAGWDGRWGGFDVAIPGDLSAAAFLLVAAQLVGGSQVTVRDVGVNPTRTGVLEVARDMGAGLIIEPKGEWGGEPVAQLHAWSAPLRALTVGGETVPRAVAELPLACALAARAEGTTRLRDAGDAVAGETFAEMATVLRAFGVTCREAGGGLDVDGRSAPLDPASVESRGAPRIAMTAAVLALLGAGPSQIRDAACIAATYPKFVATLRALGARIDVEG